MLDTAIVVCPQDGSPEAELLGLRLAGLPLMVRAVLTAQHAGLKTVLVVASAAQRAAIEPVLLADQRLRAVRWRETEDAAGSGALVQGSALVLSPLVAVDASALRTWLEVPAARGIVAPEESEAGPLIARGVDVAVCVRAARLGLDRLAALLREAWDEGRVVFRRWPVSRPAAITSRTALGTAERSLLAALGTPEDGPIVDRFVNRTFSRHLTRWLVGSPITPNQVTVASLLAGLLAAGLIAHAALPVLVGLACFQFSVVLDHADGEIARLKFQFTKLGKWLDNWSDHAVDLAVLGGVAWRAASGVPVVSVIALAIIAGIGVTGSFVVVFAWTLRRAPGVPRAHPMLALANRDGFCLTLWGTLLIGWPVLLLWLLAIGANAFWLLWLVTGSTQGARSPAARS